MFGLGAGEIFLIAAFALIFIGPKKLPELARSLGKGFREFQNAKDELLTQVHNGEPEAENIENNEEIKISEVSSDQEKEKSSRDIENKETKEG